MYMIFNTDGKYYNNYQETFNNFKNKHNYINYNVVTASEAYRN